MQRKAVLLAVALLLVPAAFSQTQVNDTTLVSIRPQMALQGFNPMKPTGVHVIGTGGSGDAVVRQITAANYTRKTVWSVEYGWRISAPAGCTDSTLPVRWQTGNAQVMIAPNGKANITMPDSLSRSGSSMELSTQARNSHAPVVLVTIGLLKVSFDDGSTWSDQEAVA